MVRIGAFFFSAIVFLMSSSVFASDKPNIIVMVADDLGWADVGFHGNQIIETPSLDRIAAEEPSAESVLPPICSPTRAALMTGGIRFDWALLTPRSCRGITTGFIPRRPSFRVICRRGLSNGDGGKWHLDTQQTYHPNARGFEHFYGHLHTEVGFFPPFASLGGKDFQRNGVSIDDQGYESYLLADEVSRYIRERDAEKPFFIYMPFIAPTRRSMRLRT